ncbi:hypothetical protein Q7C36_002678 [Tachysurus vachellii]|uniref:Uncharacterized protein n=1 Tax=Tachysurus vachellii TaxID=175792 RepID=A0AA88NYB5_TACVA|nr:hypothetical protein Q7C36_002678 [Tachysurus vachellii]
MSYKIWHCGEAIYMQPLQPSALFETLGVFVLSICDQRVHEGGVRVSLLVLLPRSGPAPQQEAAHCSPESHPELRDVSSSCGKKGTWPGDEPSGADEKSSSKRYKSPSPLTVILLALGDGGPAGTVPMITSLSWANITSPGLPPTNLFYPPPMVTLISTPPQPLLTLPAELC